jgi:hypothetical protein
MEIVSELFKNPAFTGFLGTILGALSTLITVLINRKTAIDMKERDEAFQRLKLAIDAGLEDHKFSSNLAIKRADQNHSTATLYPSVFSILHTLKIHDLLRKPSTEQLEIELLRIQKEMRSMQKNYESADEKAAA